MNRLKMKFEVRWPEKGAPTRKNYNPLEGSAPMGPCAYINNHCTDPNLRMRTTNVRIKNPHGNVTLAYLEAVKFIPAGTALSFTYYEYVEKRSDRSNLWVDLRIPGKPGKLQPIPDGMCKCLCEKDCSNAIIETGPVEDRYFDEEGNYKPPEPEAKPDRSPEPGAKRGRSPEPHGAYKVQKDSNGCDVVTFESD